MKIHSYDALQMWKLLFVTSVAGLHGASSKARQVYKYLAPSYLLRVDINLPKFYCFPYLKIYQGLMRTERRTLGGGGLLNEN
jgi:hypothetical protein